VADLGHNVTLTLWCRCLSFPSRLMNSYHRVVLLVLAIALSADAQNNSPAKDKTPQTNVTSPAASPGDEASKVRKDQAVLQVRGFVSRLMDFHDPSIRIPAVARLAELLWPYDQPYAEQLFTKMLESAVPNPNATAREAARILNGSNPLTSE